MQMRKVLQSVETSVRLEIPRENNRTKPAQNWFFSANAISLASRQMFVATLGEREGILFFSCPQSSEFLSELDLKC